MNTMKHLGEVGSSAGIAFAVDQIDYELFGGVSVEVLRGGNVIYSTMFNVNQGQTELRVTVFPGPITNAAYTLRISPRTVPGGSSDFPVLPADPLVTPTPEPTPEPEPGDPVVTSVTVTPSSAAGVRRGQNNQQRTFTAVVTGTDLGEPGTANANYGVSWNIIEPAGVVINSRAAVRTDNGSTLTVTLSASNGAQLGNVEVIASSMVPGSNGQAVVGTATISILGAASAPPADGGGGGRNPGGVIGIVTHPEGTIIPGDGDDLPPRPGHGVEPFWITDGMTPAFMVFSDVGMAAWYHRAVTIVYHYGLMHGYPDGTFRPYRNITRAEFVQVLANHAGVNLSSFAGASSDFSDVAASHWALPAIQWAQSAGFNLGVGDNNFAPEADITRQEMASLLRRHANAMGITLQTNSVTAPTDEGSISAWAAEDVAIVRAARLMNAHDTGAFDPHGNATRAQVAQVFANLIDNYGPPPGR